MLTLLPVSPDDAAGYYASQADVEDVFGRSNVARWSQQDAAVTDADSCRIQKALDHADATIDNEFRGSGYAVPLRVGAGRATVTRWAAVIAGVWLYATGNAGAPQAPAAYTALLEQVTAEMRRYVAGSLRLDAAPADPSAPTAPTLV